MGLYRLVNHDTMWENCIVCDNAMGYNAALYSTPHDTTRLSIVQFIQNQSIPHNIIHDTYLTIDVSIESANMIDCTVVREKRGVCVVKYSVTSNWSYNVKWDEMLLHVGACMMYYGTGVLIQHVTIQHIATH